jgi:hypothetical protein
MAAYNSTGKMILFIRSIMWDLGIPQEAATVLYKDNNACTAMGNAHKPTTCMGHMDIKYFLFVNGSTSTLCTLNELTQRSTCWTISQKVFLVPCFINTPTSFSAMSPQHIHLFTNLSLGRTQRVMSMLMNTFQTVSQPPSAPKLPGLIPHTKTWGAPG